MALGRKTNIDIIEAVFGGNEWNFLVCFVLFFVLEIALSHAVFSGTSTNTF